MEIRNQEEIVLPSTNPEKAKFRSRRKIIVAGILAVLLLVVLPASSALIIVFLLQPVKVEGNTMAPMFNNGDRVFIRKSPVSIRRGDVVVFWYRKSPPTSFMKRAIGLPNDVIEIKFGKVFINNQPIEEPYLATEHTMQKYNFGPETVPIDSYFVMGDNRDASNDSRAWGPVARNMIYGKVIGRYFEANSK